MRPESPRANGRLGACAVLLAMGLAGCAPAATQGPGPAVAPAAASAASGTPIAEELADAFIALLARGDDGTTPVLTRWSRPVTVHLVSADAATADRHRYLETVTGRLAGISGARITTAALDDLPGATVDGPGKIVLFLGTPDTAAMLSDRLASSGLDLLAPADGRAPTAPVDLCAGRGAWGATDYAMRLYAGISDTRFRLAGRDAAESVDFCLNSLLRKGLGLKGWSPMPYILFKRDDLTAIGPSIDDLAIGLLYDQRLRPGPVGPAERERIAAIIAAWFERTGWSVRRVMTGG